MALAAELIETWQISARLNLFMIEDIADEAWESKAEKSKTPCGHFLHIHNVRLMWLKASAPVLLGDLTKLEGATSRADLSEALGRSAGAIAQLIALGLKEERIKGFKPHPVAFVGYLIAHEAFHRSQAELVLRQVGHPISDKIAYGLWEWGVR
ncbi:MAG: hypothetical protein JNK63_11025 [Chthonomonas sp.]|nr:hypothetical protein [Chthonomonas sp.]